MAELSARDYAELVERLRDLADRCLPEGSAVAVISRGDPAMLELGGRVGLHVPSTQDGRYVGHHPADGRDAVRVVEGVRARGADFLLVPETSSWWLTHYEGLRDHLEGLGSPIATEAGTGALFPLSGRPSLLDREGTEHVRIEDDLADLCRLLLPPGSDVVFLDREASLGPHLGAFRVTSLAPDAVDKGLLSSAGFLIVPCWNFDWLAGRADVSDELAREGRLVTWQRHVGAIYETGLAQQAVES